MQMHVDFSFDFLTSDLLLPTAATFGKPCLDPLTNPHCSNSNSQGQSPWTQVSILACPDENTDSRLNAALSYTLAGTQKIVENKIFCIALVHGDRDSHTFQFHFALLVHTRIITELVIILFLLIWGVQRDHCALRESDGRTYYYLKI